MKINRDEGYLKNFVYYVQIAFSIVIACFTAWNSYLLHKQSQLMYRPFVGVTGVNTTRFKPNDKADTYENTVSVQIKFVLENTGSIPARNVKIDVTGKLGDTILQKVEPLNDEGAVIPPHSNYFNIASLGNNEIKRLVENKDDLIYSMKISYSDFEGYKFEEYTSYFEVKVLSKNPLNLQVNQVSKSKWDQQT